MNLELNREFINIRCPDCAKTYSVLTREIREARPRFECAACHQVFVIDASAAVAGGVVTGEIAQPVIVAAPAAMPESNSKIDPVNHQTAPQQTVPHQVPNPPAQQRTPSIQEGADISRFMRDLATFDREFDDLAHAKLFNCPKCAEPYSGGQTECEKCGIVFSKFDQVAKGEIETIAASPELKDSWSNVLEDYENFAIHQAFVNQAWGEENLEYASKKYTDILSVCPHDELAKKAVVEIEALSVARFQSVQPELKGAEKIDLNIRLPKVKISNMILFLSGILIAMGLILPQMRNLIGLGSAIVFSILALRYYFRAI